MGFENESNDDKASANAAISGVAMKGQLSSSSDKDYYKITTSGAGTIAINFDAPTNSTGDYFKLSLTDSSGTVLAAQDTGKDTTFSAGVGSAGSYYVFVQKDYWYSSGQYSLRVHLYL